MMTGSGLGAPGERQSGKRDAKTEIWLLAGQHGFRVLLDYITFLAALLLGFTLGRWGIVAAVAFGLWFFAPSVADWAHNRIRNARLRSVVLLLAEDRALVVYTVLVGVLVFLVVPYQWGYDLTTHEHYLIVLRRVPVVYHDATGVLVSEMRPDNIVRRFSLLWRVLLAGLPVSWFLTAGRGRRRFGFELDQVIPGKAVDYATVGFDARRWGPDTPVQPAPEVRVRRVTDTPNGSRVDGYDVIEHAEEVRLAFRALNAGAIARISRAELVKVNGIGQHVARAIINQLRSLGYIEYPNGDNNAAELTDYGRGLAEAVASGAF